MATKRLTQVTTGERTVRGVDVSGDSKRLVYLANDPTHLDDLYSADLSGAGQKQLTHLNATLWKQLALVSVERVPFKGADGWDVDGFLMKPVGWDSGKKYPLVLSVHGGPAGMYGFDWFHEFQVYAARGWAVFFTNPRGSTGYGEKFDRGVQMEWGGKAYTDIMNGVEAVLAKNPWIDADRLGVTGGSYGGYMTNWIISHTTRFKAAVTLRSISNFVSDDGTRDGAYGHSDDFGGDIFTTYDTYWNYSPLKYANRVKTPTLVLHSDNDYRVPDRAGGAVVPCAAAFRRAERDRLLPAREPQPDAHRRAEAPRREPELAGVPVRSILERQRIRRPARRARTPAIHHEHA